MNKTSRDISPFLILLFLSMMFSSCAITPGDSSATPPQKTLDERISVMEITLIPPKDAEAQSYLGLSGDSRFSIPQIEAEIVLINVFSTTCPHCQKEAPNTNQLYQTIEERPDLKGKIKIIGIGARDTIEGVAIFKTKFEVPFPLFPDEDMSLFEKLGARATPTLIGVKLSSINSPTVLFSKTGSIGEVDWFIDFLIEMAGLKKEPARFFWNGPVHQLNRR